MSQLKSAAGLALRLLIVMPPGAFALSHREAPVDTPAQIRITAARQQLQADPKNVQAYNELALALLARTRETANSDYLNDAETAIAQGLSLEADDFQLQKTQIALMLSRHQFTQAKERARVLNQHIPDDVMTYGYLAEADIALGDYSEAETNAQWMLNLRPNNIPGLVIGAKLQVLYGDAQGAIDLLNQSYSETSPTEAEELAWIANQIASIQIDSGHNDAAEQTLKDAEQKFPRYPFTIENLARVRLGQNRASDSMKLWIQAESLDSDPQVLYELASAQEAAGQPQDAHATYAEFESLANDSEKTTDESRLDLIGMYANNAATAPKALTLAQQEIAERKDVWTMDAYAWALYVNGRYQIAEAEIQKAMAVGIQSARIFDHAGHIAEKLGHSWDASRYFALSVQSNPCSEYASDARRYIVGAIVAATGVQQESPIIVTPPAEVKHDPATNVYLSERIASSARVETTTATPNFAPVPEVLLIPHPTGTRQLVRNAQEAVARNRVDAKAYAGLGAAYFQHARETGDVSDYELAEQSLAKSLDLVSADFSADIALGTMAEVCMGEHRFADALTYAQRALSLGSGDVSPFAIVGDAYADMGEYDKAFDAYGRLTPRDMTLSPRAAYARDSRLSYLKFVSGDTEGAIGLMKTAVTEGLGAQLPSENLAWLYYELGEYFTQAGDPVSADSAYIAALKTHPGDYRSLAALAKLRANNGRYAEAIEIYQKAIAVVPMPMFIAELGDLYTKTGNQQEARKQYALVEYIGLLGHINQVLHNRDLALFYADHDMKLVEALDIAKKELEVRHDIYTWDTLAWVLFKNGKLTEASDASKKALQCGTRDSLLLFHAAMIADAAGQRDLARSDLKEALRINPHFHLIYANAAKQRLAALEALSDTGKGSVSHGF